MTEDEVRAVEQLAVHPAQRLIIALLAVHAARLISIQLLTLADVDLPNRRITLAGHRNDSASWPTERCRPGSTIVARPGRTPPTGTS